MTEFWQKAYELLTRPLIHSGGNSITLLTLVIAIFSSLFIILIARLIHGWLVHKVFIRRHQMDKGVAEAIATIIKYLIIALGFFILFQAAGINLSGLGFLVGALGVGIGFGLQNITNNFISGIIILFERPIKVGDRIEVNDISGDVVRISARATTILTNDNITLIVPNSEFISGTVINWTNNDNKVSFRFDVGVSYNEDPEKIKQLLLEVAAATKGILTEPAPMVLFDSYGDSALNFKLRVWTTDFTHRPTLLRSQLYFEIFAKFKEHGVEIPFPQRDIHIRSEQTKRLIIESSKTGDAPESDSPSIA